MVTGGTIQDFDSRAMNEPVTPDPDDPRTFLRTRPPAEAKSMFQATIPLWLACVMIVTSNFAWAVYGLWRGWLLGLERGRIEGRTEGKYGVELPPLRGIEMED